MELFTSNLTDRLKPGRNIQNLQNKVKRGCVGVTSPTFAMLGPPLYLGNG